MRRSLAIPCGPKSGGRRFPKAHPFGTRRQAADFAGQDIIVRHAERGPRCGRHALDLLDMLDESMRIVAEVGHYQTALMLVQAGAGIASFS